MNTKLTCDIHTKETIDESDFILCTGQGSQKDGLATSQDFLIKARDFADKIRSKNQLDRLKNLLRNSHNMDIKSSKDGIVASYNDEFLTNQYSLLMDDISDLAKIVEEVVTSKAADWKEVVSDTINPRQIRVDQDNITILQDDLTPEELLNIVSPRSNISISQDENGLNFSSNLANDSEIIKLKNEIDELKKLVKSEPSVREGKLLLLFNQTLRYLSACHLDITPSCNATITDANAGSNVNSLLSFNYFSYVDSDLYNKKTQDLILQMQFQNVYRKIDFAYLTNSELGYFEIPENSLWFVSHKDLSFAQLNNNIHPLCISKDNDLKMTIMINVNKKSQLNQNNKILFINDVFELIVSNKNAKILINNDEEVLLNWDILDFSKNIILTVVVDFKTISMYARQNNSTLFISKSVSMTMVNFVNQNDAKLGLTASQPWYCSGITIFSDALAAEQINNYIDNLYVGLS